MIKLFCLFTLFVANISMHAMENDRMLVPFDEPTHGAQARAIFEATFEYNPDYLQPNYRCSDGLPVVGAVLLLQKTVIGILAYYDFWEPNTSRMLNRVAIDAQYRNKPEHHGTFFVQKFEEKSLKEGKTSIEVISRKSTVDFYTRLGYKPIWQHTDYMQKALIPANNHPKD